MVYPPNPKCMIYGKAEADYLPEPGHMCPGAGRIHAFRQQTFILPEQCVRHLAQGEVPSREGVQLPENWHPSLVLVWRAKLSNNQIAEIDVHIAARRRPHRPFIVMLLAPVLVVSI